MRVNVSPLSFALVSAVAHLEHTGPREPSSYLFIADSKFPLCLLVLVRKRLELLNRLCL
jgi:hypothetical protein